VLRRAGDSTSIQISPNNTAQTCTGQRHRTPARTAPRRPGPGGRAHHRGITPHRHRLALGSRKTTRTNGHVCVSMFCNETISPRQSVDPNGYSIRLKTTTPTAIDNAAADCLRSAQRVSVERLTQNDRKPRTRPHHTPWAHDLLRKEIRLESNPAKTIDYELRAQEQPAANLRPLARSGQPQFPGRHRQLASVPKDSTPKFESRRSASSPNGFSRRGASSTLFLSRRKRPPVAATTFG